MIDLGTIKQGERGTLTINWEFPDSLTSPASIVGGTITAVAQNLDTGDTTAITGTITATAATVATWELSDGDSGTDGTYAITFKAVVSGVATYTLDASLKIAANPAAVDSQNPLLVGVPAVDASWLGTAVSNAAAATENQTAQRDADGNLKFVTVDTSGNVDSVNGQTGIVVLDAADVGADPTGSAAAVASDLSDHEGDTANPHSVTAAQADAVPEDAAILSKSAGYELAAGDEAKIIECDGTFTVTAPDGLDNGFQVVVVNVGSGTITLSAATTLQSKDSNTQLANQYGSSTIYHRGSNVWLAFGDLS